MHIYNIFRQYSGLKYLKNNIVVNKVILSVDLVSSDFSRNSVYSQLSN